MDEDHVIVQTAAGVVAIVGLVVVVIWQLFHVAGWMLVGAAGLWPPADSGPYGQLAAGSTLIAISAIATLMMLLNSSRLVAIPIVLGVVSVLWKVLLWRSADMLDAAAVIEVAWTLAALGLASYVCMRALGRVSV